MSSKYTAIITEATGQGSHWVGSVEASGSDDAKAKALVKCAEDWYGDSEGVLPDLHVLALFEGDVHCIHYDDSIFH